MSDNTTQRGFTLVEVAASVGLLVILFVGVYSGLTHAVSGHRAANEEFEKRVFLSRICEEMRSVTFNDLLEFDGLVIEDEGFEAALSVVPLSEHLLQAQVDVMSLSNPEVSGQALLILANSN